MLQIKKDDINIKITFLRQAATRAQDPYFKAMWNIKKDQLLRKINKLH
tara:strand:+ start:871 stop:1014 length:144 start_codon:yes stop_codon:yes gene_type:complete